MLEYRMEGSPPGRPLLGKRSLALLSVIIVACLTGCGSVPIAGLHPEYPPVEKGTFSLYCDFVVVDSLQPTFRWQPFPRAEDFKADKEGALNRIEAVTYELRIWKTTTGESGTLVYAREGLKVSHHTLEKPLEPSTQYLWTVRACFEIEGRFRLIEWSLAGNLLQDQTVPNESCFRFETPEK